MHWHASKQTTPLPPTFEHEVDEDAAENAAAKKQKLEEKTAQPLQMNLFQMVGTLDTDSLL